MEPSSSHESQVDGRDTVQEGQKAMVLADPLAEGRDLALGHVMLLLGLADRHGHVRARPMSPPPVTGTGRS